MKVYETDQWTSVQVSRQGLTVADLEESQGEVYGGDADSVRVIFGGGRVVLREVPDDARPAIASVWFVPGEDGILKIYRANYDTSD